MSVHTEDLIRFIGKQLDPENLSNIINISISKTLSDHIDHYIKKELESLISSIVQKELNEIRSQFNLVIVEFYQHLQKNLDMFRSLQIFLANKGINKTVDPICEDFTQGNYTEGFKKLMNVEEDEIKAEYLKIVDFSKITEENIDQKVAIEVASWAISRLNNELVEKMINVIRKGEGLTSLLRKIVSKQSPALSSAKAMIIKKSL